MINLWADLPRDALVALRADYVRMHATNRAEYLRCLESGEDYTRPRGGPDLPECIAELDRELAMRAREAP